MRLVLDQSPAVAHWVACHIPLMKPVVETVPFGEAFGASTAIGVVNDQGELVGGVVYHNWQPLFRSIEVSFAATDPRWLNRDILSALLSYPFDGLGCRRLSAFTPKRNHRARRFLDRFGFKREGVARFGFGDDHAIISGLLRKEWEQSRFNRNRVERGTVVEQAQSPKADRSRRDDRRPTEGEHEQHDRANGLGFVGG